MATAVAIPSFFYPENFYLMKNIFSYEASVFSSYSSPSLAATNWRANAEALSAITTSFLIFCGLPN
jgi:hypothetical protein